MNSPNLAHAFHYRLEQTFQQTHRARARVENMPELLESACAKLGNSGTDASEPMSTLARRLCMSALQIDFVWSAVACSVDGRLVPHLEALGGAHVRRGLSPALFAMLAELDDATVADLAHWLASPNPLVGAGLLVAAESSTPASRPYVASSRLVAFLAGREHD